MQSFIKFLRSLGSLGSAAANAIAFLTANWVVVVTVAASIAAGLSDWAIGLVLRPGVQAALIVFIALLWTAIGITVLADRRKPREIKAAQDYRYGLTFEGLQPNIQPDLPDLFLGFAVQFRNYSSGPIRYTIDHADIRIGTRSLPRYVRGTATAYMARGGAKVSGFIPFKHQDVSEFFGRSVDGSAEFGIVYGHPEHAPVRRLFIVMELTMHFPQEGFPLAFGANIIQETDSPIENT